MSKYKRSNLTMMNDNEELLSEDDKRKKRDDYTRRIRKREREKNIHFEIVVNCLGRL